MEDVKKLLEQNEDYLLSSSDENDTDDESLCLWTIKNSDEISIPNNRLLEVHPSNSKKCTKRNGEKRLPTRRPDPNVYNRNALLARENRLKKKMYLESIEKELQDTRKANRVLAKALKRQLKIAKRLLKEKEYFEGLIKNGTEKMTSANTLNLGCILEEESDKSPLSSVSNSEGFTFYSMGNMASARSLGSSLNDVDALSIQFDSTSDGIITSPSDNSLCDFSSLDFCTFPDFFTDLENDHSLPSSSTTWDNIWGDNGYHIDNLILTKSNIENINGHQIVSDDHTYVTTTMSGNGTHENTSESSEYIDVECHSLQIGNWPYTARTPPLQLLSSQ